MTRPAPPVLTVRLNGSERSFAAGHEVVIGRDVHADVRIADPRISRAHLIVRFDQGRWLAIDNGSLNGTYLNGYRMPVIDIHDGQSINVGNPHGPRLTFAIGPAQGHASRPGRTRPMQDSGPPTLTWSVLAEQTNPTQPPLAPRGQSGSKTTNPGRSGPRAAPSRPMPPKQPTRPTNPPPRQPVSQPRQAPPPPPMPTSGMRSQHTPPDPPTVVNAGSGAGSGAGSHADTDTGAPSQPDSTSSAEFTVIDARTGDVSNLATRMVKFLTPRTSSPADKTGTVTIGRAADNDIVVSDVLASRQHATLVQTPLGTEIRDVSVNGTFVNGTRVGSAILTEDDVVTIGNVDLVFRDGTLIPSSEAAARTGGLEVRGVRYVVDNGKQLLDEISLSARPGTLTAVIGGSGAGKSTLARLIAGYARPTSGSVSFEGHDIHAEYASLRSRIGMVPQDDVVHRQLTVNQALGYAAELRLPPDTSKSDRARVVAKV
ncbi:FHA domain-containing protein, partial [Mycobacterium sp.]|uniref:FHA domain-containing protein n=1 Tax=Mycobacterium sp. TaxID=1785 RepID=UPI003C744D43